MRDIIPYENKYPLDKRSDDEILEQRRGSFIDFVTLDRTLNRMTREQKGDFLESVREYFKSDIVPDESIVGERVCSAFDIFQPLEVSNRAKYVQKCRRQRHNALKRSKKNPDADQDEEDSHRYPQQAMADDKDIDIGTDIETEIVIDKGTGVAIATLIESAKLPSSSYTSNDVQPLLVIEELPDDVFITANISKDIVTDVILHFCRRYKDVLNRSCPMIDCDFAKTIPDEIVNLIDQATGEYLFDSSKWNHDPNRCTQWYKDMIDMYFDTEFKEGCNYSLQHFFSGNIRVLRYHEVGRLPYEF